MIDFSLFTHLTSQTQNTAFNLVDYLHTWAALFHLSLKYLQKYLNFKISP